MDTTTNFNPETDQHCPYCAEVIKKEAKICRHCGYNLTTGKPVDWLKPASPAPQPQPVTQAKSSVGDGVRLGCGMFIVLPLIIIVIIIVLVAIAGSS